MFVWSVCSYNTLFFIVFGYVWLLKDISVEWENCKPGLTEMLRRSFSHGRLETFQACLPVSVACLCVAWFGRHLGHSSRGFLTAVDQGNGFVARKIQWHKRCKGYTGYTMQNVRIGTIGYRLSKPIRPLRHELRSISVSSLAQQSFDASTGFLALAGKAYAFLLLVVFVLQRKLIFLPSKQIADPRAYSTNLEVIQVAGPKDTKDAKDTAQFTLAAIYFRPKPSKPVVVPLGKHLL